MVALAVCLTTLAHAAEGPPGPEVRIEPDTTATVTGSRFRLRLDELIPGVSWKAAPLRAVLRQLTEDFEISLLCDRRIDPTAKFDLQTTNRSLRDVLEEIAAEAGGEIGIVGNVVYLGPSESASIVRTLSELRKQELLASGERKLAGRKIELRRGQTVRWGDLSSPGEILQRIARQSNLAIENDELVPHDLWAGAQLRDMPPAEMLTCVLIQFDLTFRWSEDFRSIQLVPLPDDRSEIAIERSYAPSGAVDDAIRRWREQIGDFDIRVAGRRVTVRGTVEQHELIEQIQSGRGERMDATPAAPSEVVPLDRRQFSLTVARVPVSAIMAKLEESGILFEYDADALSAAEIDLATPVSLDVKQADARSFLEAVFDPIGLAAEFSGTTVRLRPAD